MQPDDTYIFGRNAVLEALKAGRDIEKIFIGYGSSGPTIAQIYKEAKKNKIPHVTYDKKRFANLAKKALTTQEKSQGVIAIVSLIKTIELEDLLEIAWQKEENPVIAALDEINDPHNLGAIARSAECAGVAGIILPERRTVPVTSAAIKASAGALEHIKVADVGNLAVALDKCKEAGFWIIGTDSEAQQPYTDNIYDRPGVIVIGSEGKGIRNITKKACDILVKIPLKGKISSLNASVAAGVILFERLRQINS